MRPTIALILGLAAASVVGVSTAEAQTQPEADAILGRVQNDLFDLGADLCRPEAPKSGKPSEPPPLRVTAGQVARL